VPRSHTADTDGGIEAGVDAAADGGASVDFADGGATSFDDTKQALLAELATADDSCHLRPELTPAPNPFADLESSRAAFDSAIRGDVVAGNEFMASPTTAPTPRS